jgi:hypothetical protein
MSVFLCFFVCVCCSWNYENLLRQYVKADETLRTSGEVRLIDVFMNDQIVFASVVTFFLEIRISRDTGVGFQSPSENNGSSDRPRHASVLIPSCPTHATRDGSRNSCPLPSIGPRTNRHTGSMSPCGRRFRPTRRSYECCGICIRIIRICCAPKLA